MISGRLNDKSRVEGIVWYMLIYRVPVVFLPGSYLDDRDRLVLSIPF